MGAVLAALMVAMSFAGGHLGPTRQKLLVVFTVTAFHAIILCQYVGCGTPAGCGARGSFRFFMSFVLSFSIGAAFSMASSLIFPWCEPEVFTQAVLKLVVTTIQLD